MTLLGDVLVRTASKLRAINGEHGRLGHVPSELGTCSRFISIVAFCRKPETTFREILEVAALREAGIAEQVTDADESDPAAGDNSVKRDDPAAAAPLYCAYDVALKSYALECLFGCSATGLMEFRRIEIGKADLDPLIGIGRLADAKTVSVANVPDGTENWEPAPFGRRFAQDLRGRERRSRGRRACCQEGEAGGSCGILQFAIVFLLFQDRTDEVIHRAMPARFSGM